MTTDLTFITNEEGKKLLERFSTLIKDTRYFDCLDADIRPDIIIHKRGTDEHNIAYIEIKKEQNHSSRDHDFDKIIDMTSQKGEFKYQLGVFIDFKINKEDLIIKYFIDGKEP